jgi:glyoxylase-like metal-dependent hydrolase (beta-lactamase superfamily II)
MKPLLIATLLLLMFPAQALPPGQDTGYAQVLTRIDKHVWLMAEPAFQLQPIGNVTIIEQRDGFVLVDAGGTPGAARAIIKAVHKIGRKPVKAVILSQWHGDKVQGLSEILRVWPKARTIATAATKAHLGDPAAMNSPAAPDAQKNGELLKSITDTAAAMREGAAKAPDAAMRQGYARAAISFDLYAKDMDGALTIAPEEAFTDKVTLDDPIAPAELLFLGRANTDGDAIVWLPKQKILMAGETVILPFPYGYKSYPAEWLAVLAKLRDFDFKLLLPGHGAPQSDRAQIDKIAAALTAVRAQVGPLVAQGLTLEQVQAKVDLHHAAQSFCGDDPWLRRWFAAFFVDPIVASAYHEAKGEPITQGLR